MTETVYISPTDVRFSGGKFNSRNRYLVVGSGLGSFLVAAGKTLDVGQLVPTSVGRPWFVYSSGTYRVAYTLNTVNGMASGSFVATTTPVIVQ